MEPRKFYSSISNGEHVWYSDTNKSLSLGI